MKTIRSSGTLLHITSLPSPYGIGDMGPSAYEFAEFLHETGQSIWQILPLNPTTTGMGNSPYSSPSAFAGNTLLISPELLVKEGYLEQVDLEFNFTFDGRFVDFLKVTAYKTRLLKKAFEHFNDAEGPRRPEYVLFCKQHALWLDDYALYMALKNHNEGRSWVDWDKGVREREPEALQQAKQQFKQEIEQEKFWQYLFYDQWNALKNHCNKLGVQIFGDLPFYVGHDSADIWVFPQYFKLDKNHQPTKVSGVPPDYFSETGQLWGTPVYDWKVLLEDDFHWWAERISHNLKLFDLLRLDHFRAFSQYWEVEAGEETALNGKWVKSPGKELFTLLQKRFPDLPIVAEDLGEIDEPVRDLMAQFNLPGMALLLFAFGPDIATNAYTPHNHKEHLLVYTGTHDNITVKGWYKHESTDDDRLRLQNYAGRTLRPGNVANVMVRLALMSVADTAILPMQDILGLGRKATMNKPSTTDDNWIWRMSPDAITPEVINNVRILMETYGRSALPKKPEALVSVEQRGQQESHE